MAEEDSPKFTVDRMIEYIARGHAFDKHVLGRDRVPFMKGINAFREEHTKAVGRTPMQSLGKDLFIETPDDLADYIKNHFMTSPDTVGYVAPENGGINLYNSADNVAVHFSWKNGSFDFGTVYRYPTTQNRFESGRAVSELRPTGVVPFKSFSNADDPNAARSAVEEMIADIMARPERYLFNTNNPDSTIEKRVLERESRPGRNWDHDEVINAPNNVKGHSEAYAKAHGMNIAPEEFKRVQQEMEKEFNIGRVRKSLRSVSSINLSVSEKNHSIGLIDMKDDPELA